MKKEAKEAFIQKVLSELRGLQLSNDCESAHSDADGLLCEFLTALGFEQIVAEYEKIEKWFA